MRNILILLLLFSISFVNGQNLKTLKSKLGSENNYSKSEFDYWKKATGLLSKINSLENEIEYSEMNLKNQKAIDSLEMGYGPMTEGVGCSWYCGGGPYKISSSSILKNNQNYSDQNIHDFDLFTGWVPKSENGIGESISFHFKAKSPRINAVVIYNGYIKTNELWKNNSRAKKVKLKIDNKTIAILELEDTTASQRFEIDPISSTIENKDLVLTLEIMESYKGEKYTDLVISEINFDGTDVHCLAQGTLITMSDYTQKAIENLTIGDEILSFNKESGQYESSIIRELANQIHKDLINIEFSNGIQITCTKDHPFLTNSLNWTSMNPDKTEKDYEINNLIQLKVGTEIKNLKNKFEVVKIKEVKGEQITYTIVDLNKNNTFIANGILTGIEKLRVPTVCIKHSD